MKRNKKPSDHFFDLRFWSCSFWYLIIFVPLINKLKKWCFWKPFKIGWEWKELRHRFLLAAKSTFQAAYWQSNFFLSARSQVYGQNSFQPCSGKQSWRQDQKWVHLQNQVYELLHATSIFQDIFQVKCPHFVDMTWNFGKLKLKYIFLFNRYKRKSEEQT